MDAKNLTEEPATIAVLLDRKYDFAARYADEVERDMNEVEEYLKEVFNAI